MRRPFRDFCVSLAGVLCLLATAASAQDKFFDSNGVRLRYVDGGTGAPVVLVHGYANSIETWSDRGVLQRIRDLEGDTPFRATVVGLWPPDQPPPTEDQIRERSLELARKNDPLALAAFVKSLRGHVVTDAQVAAVRMPTLGIVGSADAALAGMRQLKTVLPSLELVVVDGATHAFERGILGRAEFVDTIRRFIRAHSQASP
jgi:pimeloyl-ACP methyl ester carboxylesterase